MPLVFQDLVYMTRIHYLAESDGDWSEHEMDYIFLSRPGRPVEVAPNPNEVCEVQYVTPGELKGLMRQADVYRGEPDAVKLTPWSRAIMDRFLFVWWEDMGNLDRHVDDKIHRIGRVVM